MVADEASVDRQSRAKQSVDCFDGASILDTSGHVGLVGDQDKPVSGGSQQRESFRGLGIDTNLVNGLRRIGFALAHDRLDHNAITIEKYGMCHGSL